MAYFSNGTEGMMYVEQYCGKCVNYVDLDDGRNFGCPLWDAHHLFEVHKGPQADVLRHLIPDSTFNDNHEMSFSQCAMFKTPTDVYKLSGKPREYKLGNGETGVAMVGESES